MPFPQTDKTYTYADYVTWPEDERWEIIDGIPYLQAAPSWQHQSVSAALLAQFYNQLSGKTCKVFAAPFDLRLPIAGETDQETSSVVQPDLVVICDYRGLSGTGYYGTPDLIIEISSPTTVRMDKIWKFSRYERAGVNEYWIVEPEAKFVSVFTLQSNKKYGRPELYTETDTISSTFPGLEINLVSIFEEI